MNGGFDESDRVARRRLEAQLAEQDARGLRLAGEVERLDVELTRVREGAQKDYDDMRRFQARFIEADQRLRRIEEAVKTIAEHWPSEDKTGAEDYRELKGIARAALADQPVEEKL